MAITAAMVKELRDRTGLGMMACRNALAEADGDAEKAIEFLRKSGEIKAAKKAEREVKDGSIAVSLSDDATTGTMVEVSCETDFVAKNPEFRAMVEGFAATASGWEFEGVENEPAKYDTDESMAKAVTDAIAKLGENMIFRRAAKFTAANGIVGFYVHSNFKIGVLVELECPAEARGKDEVRALAKDLCMQAASLNAICTNREEVPADVIEKEREIYREQIKDKPENIQDKIIDGKIEAYYKECVLLEQAFIKEQKQSVAQHVAEVGKNLGIEIKVKRFVRFNTAE